MRSGFINELCAISENLDLKKNSPFRKKYPELFRTASALRGQRDILTHRYGLPAATINWSLVWETLDSKLEDDLAVKLNKAIDKEDESESNTS